MKNVVKLGLLAAAVVVAENSAVSAVNPDFAYNSPRGKPLV
jgi:hypothetical protein